MVSFIFPPLLYLKLNNEKTTSDKVINYTLATIGIVSAIYSTVTTIRTL